MGKTVLCKNIANIFYLRFVKPGQSFKSVSSFDLTGKNLIDMSWLNVDYYDGYPLNEHHITTASYYKVILPFLKLYIKDFPFDINDFEYVPYAIVQNNKIFDISYLKPKKEFKFSMSRNGKELFTNGDFSSLHYMEGTFDDPLNDDLTDYHKLYRGYHSCSRVINDTIDNDLSIFITGDSMSIPLIPVLACYFKEVVLMDNRDFLSHSDYYENKNFDYVIIQLWEGHHIDKPLKVNLM